MLRFIDHHQDRPLVIVPGWAFDHRIFAALGGPYDYHIFKGPSMAHLAGAAERLVSEFDGRKVSLLGWSKGAFAACAYAGRHPELVDELFLVGARPSYGAEELEQMQENLRKNKTACLKGFYRRCFAREETQRYRWFKDTLQESYLETTSTERLTHDLDWLGQVTIEPEAIRPVEKIKFVHGAADAIAPLEQARALAEALPQSQLITFERTGHIPFLRDDFWRRVHES